MSLPKAISASTLIKDSSARLTSITFPSTSAGTCTVYNHGSATAVAASVVLDTLTPTAGTHLYFGDEGIACDKGLYVVIANQLKALIGFK